MIDLEKEREAFNAEFKNIGREYSTNLNSVGFSGTLSANELGWLACAESKQAEIDSLKAQLAKVESGEYVVVPKEPTFQMKQAAYKQYDTGLISITEIYQAMIEAAQENSHE